jgi:hypothetical protein
MSNAQEAADAAYRAYEQALQRAQDVQASGSPEAYASQNAAQRSALQDLAQAAAASQAANAAVATYSSMTPITTTSFTPTYSGRGAPAPQPTPPNPWMTNVTYTAPVGIKQADPDLIIFDDEITTGTFLVDRFFEEIGGIELINISRSDIINGDIVTYTPIKNLSSLRRQYNPNNIIAIASTAQSAFSRFKIDLLLRGINDPYIDDDGNLVIEVDTVNQDEFIEAEIATSGTINRIEL